MRAAPWRVVRGAFASFVVQREEYDKNWGSKKPFLEVAVAAPARVIGLVSYSPRRRVALRDAIRALSCAPYAIAATFEDTAADIAEERRGSNSAFPEFASYASNATSHPRRRIG